MQAQTQMSKGELLFEVQGKTMSRSIKEITPHGVRMENNDEGQISGKITGNQLNTVNIFLKTDGSVDWEGKGLLTTREGDMFVVSTRGTGRSTSPTSATWQGDAIFMTQSPKLAWLNTTKGWIEGTGDMAQGTYKGKVYAKK